MELRLHSKQGVALQSPATEILYGGAAGGGKSYLLRVAAITWAHMIPGLHVYLFRRTYPDLWRNHMEGPQSFPNLLAEWINKGICSIHVQRMQIEFWHGSRIHLCYCQRHGDVYAYQGPEIHVLMIDELTHFEDRTYRFLRSRVRLGGLKIPEDYLGLFPRILCASNPGNIGHNWVKSGWVDPEPPLKIWRAERSDGGKLRQFIPARMDDNPTLLENDPDYVMALEGLGNPALVSAMKEGDWDIVAGGALDDVWDRKRHVLAPFAIPKTWRIDRGFDWGSSKPFAVLWYAESDGCDVTLADGTEWSTIKGDVFVIRELYGWNGNPNEGVKATSKEVARRVKRIDDSLKVNVRPGPADSSIYVVDDDHCIADEMAEEGVVWKKSNKGPGSRIQGLELLRRYLLDSIDREGPGLFFFETCRHCIRTIPVLPRDEKNMDDVDTNAEDHCYDAIRYRLLKKVARVKQEAVSGLM